MFFFFFNNTASPVIYTLSLHDALPISSYPLSVRAVEDHRAHACVRRQGSVPFEDIGETSDRKSTRLNSSHVEISYAVFCLKKKKDLKKNVLIRYDLYDYIFNIIYSLHF